MIVSLDLSLRSSGICLIGENGEVIDFTIVAHGEKDSNKKLIYNNEELLVMNCKDVMKFLMKYKHLIKHVAIEGLPYGAKSGSIDLLWSNYWLIRCEIFKKLKDVTLDIYQVVSWRSKVISPVRAKEIKVNIEKKLEKKGEWQKRECVRVLPDDVRLSFEKYVNKNSKKLCKGKESIYDLTDAYWIGIFKLNKLKS